MDESQLHPLRMEHPESGFRWALVDLVQGWWRKESRVYLLLSKSSSWAAETWVCREWIITSFWGGWSRQEGKLNLAGERNISPLFSLFHKKKMEFQGKEELKGRRFPLSLNKIFFLLLHCLVLPFPLTHLIWNHPFICVSMCNKTCQHYQSFQ